MSGAPVLVIDDDPAILRAVQRALEAKGFSVKELSEGKCAVATVRRFHPEIILLDLVLPDADGLDLCREILAASDGTVIVLSAIGDDAKKVEALDAGADDYLTKPFSMEELLARIRVALRRRGREGREAALEAGPLRLDIQARRVTVGDRPVHLTPREFDLLRLLLQHQGRLLTQRQILSQVWGAEYGDDSHILRTFIHQLRTKLGERADLIVTDPGVGYRLVAPNP